MTKKFDFMPTLVLSAICVVIVALLAVVNLFTAPLILAQQEAAANGALLEVLPDGTGFSELDLSGKSLPSSVDKVYKAENGGYVVQCTVAGYKPGLVIMCGIDSTGKITGAKYIQSNETLGAENGLGDRFVGHDKDSISIDLVAGSTAKMTTGAYYQAIEDALNAVVILSGGTVDLRDPATVLSDSLNAALGTEGVSFNRWFATEELSGVEALYLTDGGDAVAKLANTQEDVYVGVLADGTVVGDVDEETRTTVTEAVAVYKSATLTELVELPDGLADTVQKVYKSASGNYVLEVQGHGFSYIARQNGNTYVSGAPIVVRVALTPEGVIIGTQTVSQDESKGYGDACADPFWYEDFIGQTVTYVTENEGYWQINGKQTTVASDGQAPILGIFSNGNFSLNGQDTGIRAYDVENIAGATLTSVGYKQAVHTAVESVAILEGGSV